MAIWLPPYARKSRWFNPSPAMICGRMIGDVVARYSDPTHTTWYSLSRCYSGSASPTTSGSTSRFMVRGWGRIRCDVRLASELLKDIVYASRLRTISQCEPSGRSWQRPPGTFFRASGGTIGEKSHPTSRGCAASVDRVVTSVLDGYQIGSFSKGKLRAEP
jgi:hypothetical protein